MSYSLLSVSGERFRAKFEKLSGHTRFHVTCIFLVGIPLKRLKSVWEKISRTLKNFRVFNPMATHTDKGDSLFAVKCFKFS